MDDQTLSSRRHGIVFVLLLLLVFLIYSNTFNASWHMDDYPNITSNTSLHLESFSHESILRTFFAQPDGRKRDSLYRPVACLTFALNWYFGKDNVVGYHLVNTAIHFLTAIILYLTVLVLFETPNLKSRQQGNNRFVALLTATLWMVHPIQIQAVTYIVQRMASLAAMFYLMGLYCYLKGRLSNSPPFRGLLFAGCIVGYLLALGSKENSAMFPLALLLVEVVFFQDPSRPPTSKKLFWCAVAGVFFVVLTGTLFFMQGQIFSFLKGYASRPFTVWERLLTEPRVLVFYLTQIFYPLPSRFSFGHDIVVSTSLLKPWTTLPAILFLCGTVVLSFLQVKKRPLAAFAVLFFLLNHFIESSVVPLELVFEHRNYLPSLFLFLPIAAAFAKAFDYYQGRSHTLHRSFAVLTVFLIVGIGISTHTRNAVWSSEKSLWEDVLKKSPGLARPYQVLAAYHNQKGQYDIALQLYRKALKLSSQMPKRSRALCLNNMGNIFLNRGDYQQAINLLRKALAIYPGHEKALHNLTLALIKSNKIVKAQEYADLLNEKYYHENYLNLKAFILIKQNRPADAVPYLADALRISPLNRNVMVNLAAVFTLTGKYQEANTLLLKIHEFYPKDLMALLYLIENSLRAGNHTNTDNFIDRLFRGYSVGDIRTSIAESSNNNPETVYSPVLLAQAVAEKLHQKALE